MAMLVRTIARGRDKCLWVQISLSRRGAPPALQEAHSSHDLQRSWQGDSMPAKGPARAPWPTVRLQVTLNPEATCLFESLPVYVNASLKLVGCRGCMKRHGQHHADPGQ